MTSHLPLVYVLASRLHDVSRAGDARAVSACALVTQRRTGVIAAVRELARGYGLKLRILRMTHLGTSDAELVQLRTTLAAAAPLGRATIFVIDGASAVSGDLLTRIVRMIDEVTGSGHAAVLALGDPHGDVDAISQAVADGLGVAPVMVLGSSAFRDAMHRLDERVAD